MYINYRSNVTEFADTSILNNLIYNSNLARPQEPKDIAFGVFIFKSGKLFFLAAHIVKVKLSGQVNHTQTLCNILEYTNNQFICAC